jgi:hypothetical protein
MACGRDPRKEPRRQPLGGAVLQTLALSANRDWSDLYLIDRLSELAMGATSIVHSCYVTGTTPHPQM